MLVDESLELSVEPESVDVVPSVVVHELESVVVEVSPDDCVDCVCVEVSWAVAGSSPVMARPSHEAAKTATALPATRVRRRRMRAVRAAARSRAAGDGWRRGGGSVGGVLLMPLCSARFMSPP